VPGGRRGEGSGDFAAGGRRGTRLNLDGLGDAAGSFVMEDAGDEHDTSISLSFPFARGTGLSSGTDTWTGSGNARLVLAGEGNSVLVEEPLVVGEEGRSFEGTISRFGACVLSVTTVTFGYSVETVTTFSDS